MVSNVAMELAEAFEKITKEILLLDLANDSDVDQLFTLQSKQISYRNQLESLGIGQSQPLSDGIKTILQECLTLELELNKRYVGKKDEIEIQLNKVKKGRQMKSMYQQNYTQTDGYFIDRKK